MRRMQSDFDPALVSCVLLLLLLSLLLLCSAAAAAACGRQGKSCAHPRHVSACLGFSVDSKRRALRSSNGFIFYG